MSAAWDPAASIWWVAASEIPGLHIEAETLSEFEALARQCAPELIAANIEGAGEGPFLIEIRADPA